MSDLTPDVPIDIAQRGRELVTCLATMVRNAHVHDPTSDTWAPLVRQLGEILYQHHQGSPDSSVSLSITPDGNLTVNAYPIKPAFGEFNAFNYIIQDLHRLQVGGIRFGSGIDGLQMKKLVFAVAESTAKDDATFSDLEQTLNDQGVKAIELIAASGTAVEVPPDRRALAANVFLSGIEAISSVMESMREGKTVGFRRAKRFVEAAVDLLTVDRSLALSLTTIKNYDRYLHNHSVNVTLISLLVGAKLGFDARRLADLGLAAMLREVGKASLPEELLEKRGQFTPEDWQQLKLFPYAAVTGLLRQRGFNERTLRQVLVAFEHQFDSAEQRTISGEFTLFSRIAMMAAAYDAMTTSRPYRRRPMPPDQALRTLMNERDKHRMDVSLLKTFIHAMGLYPVGSVVLLDTGEVGIVCDPPFDFESIARPRVRLVADKDDSEFLAPPRVETTAVDQHGAYTRNIVQTVDPWRYGINVARHLLDVDVETVLN